MADTIGAEGGGPGVIGGIGGNARFDVGARIGAVKNAGVLELGNIIPSLPMLAKPIKSLEKCKLDFTNAIYEEKYDGYRLLACVSHTRPTTYYSRTLKIETNEHSFVFKLKRTNSDDDCIAEELVTDCVLDGECVYFDEADKVIPFCDTGSRKKLRKVYMVFDVQSVNGVSVMGLSTLERKHLLERILDPSEDVRLTEYHECVSLNHMQEKFNAHIKDLNNEGYMVKLKNETYTPNARRWWKMKALHIVQYQNEYDLHVNKAFRDRNGTYAILNCGRIDEKTGKFINVCKVSSGLKQADKKRIQHSVDVCGNFIRKTIVTVVADRVTKKNESLRHPVFKRFRDDLT